MRKYLPAIFTIAIFTLIIWGVVHWIHMHECQYDLATKHQYVATLQILRLLVKNKYAIIINLSNCAIAAVQNLLLNLHVQLSQVNTLYVYLVYTQNDCAIIYGVISEEKRDYKECKVCYS